MVLNINEITEAIDMQIGEERRTELRFMITAKVMHGFLEEESSCLLSLTPTRSPPTIPISL